MYSKNEWLASEEHFIVNRIAKNVKNGSVKLVE